MDRISYFDISGETYLTSTFNNLLPKINNNAVRGMALNANNNLYVISRNNTLYISTDNTYNRFNAFSKNASLGLSVNYCTNPCFDNSNNLYITDDNHNRVIKITNVTN